LLIFVKLTITIRNRDFPGFHFTLYPSAISDYMGPVRGLY